MEQKTLTNEEIARAIKVVEATTGTKIDWMICPLYITDECGKKHPYGRNIQITVNREDAGAVGFRIVDTGYYRAFRNNVLMMYARYIDDYEVK